MRKGTCPRLKGHLRIRAANIISWTKKHLLHAGSVRGPHLHEHGRRDESDVRPADFLHLTSTSAKVESGPHHTDLT